MPSVTGMSDSNAYADPVALPIGEVARLAGVTVATVRNWERAGKIKAFRTPGGQRRFWLSEVKAALPSSPVSGDSVPAAGAPRFGRAS